MTIRSFGVLSAIAAVALSLGLAAPSQAHHSFAAEFDAKKPVTVEGVVTKARIMNPHSWLYLDVKNKDGSVTNWGFEFGTPTSLKNRGVSKDDLQPGTPIRIDGYLAKNGGAFGYSETATLPGGRRVQTGSAPDANTVLGGR